MNWEVFTGCLYWIDFQEKGVWGSKRSPLPGSDVKNLGESFAWGLIEIFWIGNAFSSNLKSINPKGFPSYGRIFTSEKMQQILWIESHKILIEINGSFYPLRPIPHVKPDIRHRDISWEDNRKIRETDFEKHPLYTMFSRWKMSSKPCPLF